MKKVLVFILLMAFPSLFASHLFVLFDAGETVALKPVIEALITEGETVDVLALGTASTLMPEAAILAEVDRTWDRYKPLSQERLEEILSAYDPTVVTLGVASKIQAQVAAFYQEEVRVVAYYDNFNPIERSTYPTLIREIESLADLFLVPSTLAAHSSHAQNVQIVGNPSIEQLIQEIEEIDVTDLKNRLGFEGPFITYIGGYGSDYEEAFTLFMQCLESFPEYQVIICPHPKSDESFCPCTTTEAVALADVVVCHRSTLGIKALFAGKKVIFVDPIYHPMAEEWGAFWAGTPEAFVEAMMSEPTKTQETVPFNAQELLLKSIK